MQISQISPLSYRNSSVLCIFWCHSGTMVAGAKKHLEGQPPPGRQKGSFQDITLQRVTFATLGITVQLPSSVSVYDSFSLRLLAFQLPAIPAVHKREVNRVFSAEYLDTFVLDRKKYRWSPVCPSYALSCVCCFHSGSCFSWSSLATSDASARKVEMLLQAS